MIPRKGFERSGVAPWTAEGKPDPLPLKQPLVARSRTRNAARGVACRPGVVGSECSRTPPSGC